jgi:hypothetical protein
MKIRVFCGCIENNIVKNLVLFYSFFYNFGVTSYSMKDKIRIHLADDHQVLIDA